MRHVRLVIVREARRMPSADAVATALAPLTATDRQRFEMLPAARRARFLAGRTALRAAASELTGVDAAAIRIEATCPDCGRSHGRPTVQGEPAVFLSLGHGSGIAVAIAGHVPVGIDLEPRDTSSARIRAIRTVADSAGRDALRHWVRTEAVLKADGRGLRVDPARVVVRGRTAEITGSRPLQRYRLRRIDVHGHIGSIACAVIDRGP
ncbi:4'-phosphopantetheinyl transferase superfamily protein [Agromyces sp. Leaf222]|uniref:4'-phosphopantetheinyl transferase family protein n=1 Tax=Agromyces sp. Leaf222 TaxID=1735688 RepID=UPI0006FD0C6D|nr:hypothetical protein [Agromyces sp. Leaf222]KQM81492.1 hypothetical protein ASE68_17230 [Agromyces sp. Leaf222]